MNDLQRTPEWFSARLGKLGASRIDEATARISTGWGKSRNKYMRELLSERLTGRRNELAYTNAAMAWGIEHESEAITVYEFERNVAVEPVGFCLHPSIADFGASPDGLVCDEGLVEIKCPNQETHTGTLEGEPIDGGYIKQMQGQMACTGRKWCDWVSYHPYFAPHLRIVIRRIVRDDVMIAKLEKDAREFLRELAEKHERLVSFATLPPTMDQVALALKASVEALGA